MMSKVLMQSLWCIQTIYSLPVASGYQMTQKKGVMFGTEVLAGTQKQANLLRFHRDHLSFLLFFKVKPSQNSGNRICLSTMFSMVFTVRCLSALCYWRTFYKAGASFPRPETRDSASAFLWGVQKDTLAFSFFQTLLIRLPIFLKQNCKKRWWSMGLMGKCNYFIWL